MVVGVFGLYVITNNYFFFFGLYVITNNYFFSLCLYLFLCVRVGIVLVSVGDLSLKFTGNSFTIYFVRVRVRTHICIFVSVFNVRLIHI